jgi:hypothetical protein
MNGVFQYGLRGAAGAAEGAALLLVKVSIDAINADAYNFLLLNYVIAFLPLVEFLAVLVGAAAGMLLCFLSIRHRRAFSWFSRMVIGTGLAQLLLCPFMLASFIGSELPIKAAPQVFFLAKNCRHNRWQRGLVSAATGRTKAT